MSRIENSSGLFFAGSSTMPAPPVRRLPGAPWLYRRLFWETGAIGQTLYLEAELRAQFDPAQPAVTARFISVISSRFEGGV